MTGTSPTVSVAIPSYNCGRFLRTAIDSVLAQTTPPLEIVVADDGSTDNTPAVVAAYGARVKYLRYEHRGVVAARNALLEQVRGEWYLNLDADDWIEPRFIEAALQILTQAGTEDKLAFLYADRVDFGAYERRHRVPEFDVALLRRKNFVPFDAFFRRSAAARCGFDPAFEGGWEDYDFLVSLAKLGYVGRKLQNIPVHCRVHETSRTARVFEADRMQRLMRRMVAKHADFFSPAEAAAAIARFAPEAALRHRIRELFRSGQWSAGARLLLRTLVREPATLCSRQALGRVWAHLRGHGT